MSLNRRAFHKLSLAALGGAVSGSLVGCGETPAPAPSTTPTTGTTPSIPAEPGTQVAAAGGEGHLCRGLNECKEKGADGKNACAGQGTCASKDWYNSCGGQNACKGRGGCGENPGLNECKTQGGCHVPLMDEAWTKVRARMEEKWTKEKKDFGMAPAKADG